MSFHHKISNDENIRYVKKPIQQRQTSNRIVLSDLSNNDSLNRKYEPSDKKPKLNNSTQSIGDGYDDTDTDSTSSITSSHDKFKISLKKVDEEDEESDDIINNHFDHLDDDKWVDVDDDDDDDDPDDPEDSEDPQVQLKDKHAHLNQLIKKQIEIQQLLSQEEEEEEEDDDEEEEEEEDDEEDDEDDEIMEPKWNRSIFNELQYVMKNFQSKILDLDDEDTYDVTMVAEYAPEIFNYMHELEHKYLPNPNYMDNQDELKWEMRSVLIDWVVQVHSRFNLLPETLFLTINYIDRFLSKRKVSLSRFQLVGAVALFIAAKYEEINCPTIQEVAYMADNAYSIEDFLKAERFMIDVLEFDMGWPGPMSFLRRISKADDYDYETRTLAKYFLEITIMDKKFVASKPSWLAAGSHYLSRKLLNKGDWSDSHIFYSGYTEIQLKPLAKFLLKICENAEIHHKSIFEKYQERRYRRSSLFVQDFLSHLSSSLS